MGVQALLEVEASSKLDALEVASAN